MATASQENRKAHDIIYATQAAIVKDQESVSEAKKKFDAMLMGP